MRILIACDSFKDALPAVEVCQAIAQGVHLADERIHSLIFPMADGGEGTASILCYHTRGQMLSLQASDPLDRPVQASYGLSADGRTAFIEMAEASGLQLLKPEERKVMLTSTLGTGQLIADALARGVEKIILGIGGSATNDGGMGMARALGYRFLDTHEQELSPCGKNLGRVDRIDSSGVNSALARLKTEVICDVNNPLTGPQGAARVYARQKGATDAEIDQLEKGMAHFAGIVARDLGTDVRDEPGAGAAGGLGAGALAFLSARLRGGIDLVMELTGFEEQLKNVQLVLTGEGKLDGQTLHGKLIHGIARKARQHGVPVIALCGALEASPEQIRSIGLTAAFSITPQPMNLAEALSKTKENLLRSTFNVISSMTIVRTI